MFWKIVMRLLNLLNPIFKFGFWIYDKLAKEPPMLKYPEFLQGRYVVNGGQNDVTIKPDLAFTERLKACGRIHIKETVLKPYEHVWLNHYHIIYTTSDGKPAKMFMAFKHADLKTVKRNLRKERKKKSEHKARLENVLGF